MTSGWLETGQRNNYSLLCLFLRHHAYLFLTGICSWVQHCDPCRQLWACANNTRRCPWEYQGHVHWLFYRHRQSMWNQSCVCVCVCVCNQLCICWYKQFLNYATKKKPIGLHVVILFPVSFISTKFLKHRIFLEKKELTVTIKQWMPWYNHPGWLRVKHQVTYHKNSRSVPVPYIAA